jgi:hypothetical protein
MSEVKLAAVQMACSWDRAEIHLDVIRMLRDGLPFFRDRRPEMYGLLREMTG